jgi:hypothetical protein
LLLKPRTMTAPTYTFPHTVLTPITDKPTLATLTLLKLELYANAMFTESALGGGNHGYLALVMSPADYAAQPGTAPFVEPINPGEQPPHVPAATAPQITEANRRYDYAVAKYAEFKAINAQLKLQLIGAVHSTYIEILRDPVFGLANVSARQIILHLLSTYGILTTEDLEENRDKVKADWNPDTDIEHLWTRAMTCKNFAEGSALTLSDEAIMHLLLVPLEKTKVFPDDIKAWRILPAASQTWDAFKNHFTTRNKERTRTLSTGRAGYNALNAVTAAMAHVDVHSAHAAVAVPPGGDNRRGAAGPRPPAIVDVISSAPIIKMYYCWSCGLTPFQNHTSVTCLHKKVGHKDDATMKNLMGGSTTFKYVSNTMRNNNRAGHAVAPPRG